MAVKIDRSKRNILLDTNIISLLSNENLKQEIYKLLEEVVGYGFGIAISEIVYSEILNEASVEKDDSMYQELKGAPSFRVSKKVCVVSGRLGSFYKESGIEPKQINLGDKIIGATSILSNCIVLTTNGRDFPEPFFKEIERRYLVTNTKDKMSLVTTVYFKEPQLDYIGQFHKNRIEPYRKKIAKKKRAQILLKDKNKI